VADHFASRPACEFFPWPALHCGGLYFGCS
jgi:hypothetical protein